MDTQEARQIIENSSNIYLITSDNPEAFSCSLALFYTLKNLGKNVNLLADQMPQNLHFLAPSLDFISYPKNFVISIPESVAKISQVSYEKTPEELKINLTLDSGSIKKDNISFYFSEAKPDLIIAIGVKDFAKELPEKLNSFGFLLDSPILNIDNSPDNQKFGKINLVQEKSLTELVSTLVESQQKEYAVCLLTSLIIYTDNFKNNLTAEVFQMAANFMKQGADLKEITNNLKT